MKKRKIISIKMIRIFHAEIYRYLLMYPQKCTLKNLKKKYQEKGENAYLRVKNEIASRALRQALDPSHYRCALLARLHFTTSAKSQQKFLGSPWPNPGSASVSTEFSVLYSSSQFAKLCSQVVWPCFVCQLCCYQILSLYHCIVLHSGLQSTTLSHIFFTTTESGNLKDSNLFLHTFTNNWCQTDWVIIP